MNASRGYGRLAVVLAVAAAVAIAAVVLGAGRGVAAPQTAAQAQYGPRSTSSPTVSGTPADDQTLTATTGSWTSSTTVSFTYRWVRCDTHGANCSTISGATDKTYKVTSHDVGHTLRVVVSAHNHDGVTSATSAQTATVASNGNGGTPQGNGKSVSASSLALPDRLTIDEVKFSPSTVKSRTTITGRFHVKDEKGYNVSDALVYAIGLPYSRVSDAPEVKTGSDGWATIQFQPDKYFPRKGYIVFFVRARKSGGDTLSGISTRRLVQVTVNR
jgi:hypothetical protein